MKKPSISHQASQPILARLRFRDFKESWKAMDVIIHSVKPSMQGHLQALIGVPIALILLTTSLTWLPLVQAQRPVSKQNEIAGVKFVIPRAFMLEQPGSNKTAFMRHPDESVGLFVVVLDGLSIADEYLKSLSNDLASRFLPGQSGFEWKISQRPADRPLSSFQRASGTSKGLAGNTFVQIEYVVVKAQGHEVLLGSIGTFGGKQDAKHLFDVEGTGYSLTGWEGLFALISSVTGEKRD